MAKNANTCPICGRRSSETYRPFCTPRCQEVDLGRWLTGVYRIPGPPAELDEDAPPSSDAV
ncbi:MAG: DNA gyrase inhibitor YacG [Rhodopila sp.]|nr:DNA gyrase inhibitor YacG [Rhodopila sp.]